jgi:hypothetical protein
VPEPEFRPEAIVETLARHRVSYVLVGGFAAVIHGSPYVTTDLDIVPEASRANLERLSSRGQVLMSSARHITLGFEPWKHVPWADRRMRLTSADASDVGSGAIGHRYGGTRAPRDCGIGRHRREG